MDIETLKRLGDIHAVSLAAHETLDNERFQTLREDVGEVKETLGKIAWGVAASVAGAVLDIATKYIHFN